MTLPKARGPYTRLPSTTHDETSASSDNLVLGNDSGSYSKSSSLKVGQRMTQMMRKQKKTRDFETCQNDVLDAVAAPTKDNNVKPANSVNASGNGASVTTTNPSTTRSSSSKLAKMWKRVKKVFGVGGRPQQQQQAPQKARTRTNSSAPNNTKKTVSPSSSTGNNGAAPPVPPPRQLKSKSTLPKVDILYMYHSRYANPGYIMNQCQESTSTQDSADEQNYEAIITNRDMQEMHPKIKVEAWVAHLGESTSDGLTKGLVASTSSSSSTK